MALLFNEQTKNFLATKGKPLTIKLVEVNNCCAPTLQQLMTIANKPKDIQNYHETTIDQIPVYVQKPLNLDDAIELKVSGFGIFKSVSAKLKIEQRLF